MRRIGHCATMAMGLLALKGLRPNLSGLIGEHVAFFAANPELPYGKFLSPRTNLKTPGRHRVLRRQCHRDGNCELKSLLRLTIRANIAAAVPTH